MRQYNVELTNDAGGRESRALASAVESGEVVSTVSMFDGHRDLAIITVSDDDADAFEEAMESDDNVVRYR